MSAKYLKLVESSRPPNSPELTMASMVDVNSVAVELAKPSPGMARVVRCLLSALAEVLS